MTVGTLYVGLLITAMWLVAFTSWRLRNWRATVVLTVGTIAIVAAGIFPPTAVLWIRGAICGSVILLLLMRRGLSSVPDAEYSFIKRYGASLGQIADLKRRTLEIEPSEHVAAFAKIIDRLGGLEAPSSDWADLQADTVRELRRRLVLMRLSMRPPTETLDRADAEWSRVQERFRRMLRARRGFWVGLPRLFRRSDG